MLKPLRLGNTVDNSVLCDCPCKNYPKAFRCQVDNELYIFLFSPTATSTIRSLSFTLGMQF